MKIIITLFLIFTTININSQSIVSKRNSKFYSIPIYKGCENKSKDSIRKCLYNSVTKFISDSLNASAHKIKEDGFFIANFKIDNKGKVYNEKVITSNDSIKPELIRILKGLPNINPSTVNGIKIITEYIFKVDYQINSNPYRISFLKAKNAGIISYDQKIDIYPRFEKNRPLKSFDRAKLRFTSNIVDYVSKRIKLPKGKHKIPVAFNVTKEGKIESITVSANERNKKSIIEVLKEIENIIPGKYQGNSISVFVSVMMVLDVAK